MLTKAQRSVRDSRAQQMRLWDEAVQIAEEWISQLTPNEKIPYGKFVRRIARESGIDVPAARRVFDYLEGQGLVTYKFGHGVQRSQA